jgi:hypothetical protein
MGIPGATIVFVAAEGTLLCGGGGGMTAPAFGIG